MATHFSYKQIESALSTIFEVPPTKMGAFRARLRYLRKIGVPKDLPKPGSGQRIGYDRGYALIIMIALELQELGHSPRSIPEVADKAVRRWSPHWDGTLKPDKRGDVYIITGAGESASHYSVAYGVKTLTQFLERRPLGCSIINVTACAQKLFGALDKIRD